MKFSIININTFFVILLILICTSILSYTTLLKGVLFSDLLLIGKFFLVIITVINIFVIGFIVFKFRLIAITKRQIFIIYPFKLQLIKSEINKISNLRWSCYIDSKANYYRQLTFKIGNKKSIAICDKEFENLDSLAQSISKGNIHNKKVEELNKARAKSNKSNQLFNVIFAAFLFLSIIYISIKMENWNSIKFILITVISILNLFLLYFNLKKYFIYRKILSVK
ncbi:MAG: hypothetical protein WBY99_07530 [Kaistella sp.]